MTSNRIEWIDQAKGFAILTVVLRHLSQKYGFSSFEFFIASFHMPLFMCLSGMMAYDFGKQKAGRLKKKAIHLLIPFFTVGLILHLVIGSSLNDFLFESSHCGYWYLIVLYLFIVIRYVTDWMMNKMGRQSFIIDCVLSAFPFFVFASLAFSHIPERAKELLSLAPICRTYLYFVVGIFVMKYVYVNKLMFNKIILFLALAIYIILYIIPHHNDDLVWMACALFGMVAVLNAFHYYGNCLGNMGKWLSAIGRYTLSIYIFHYFFIKLFPISMLPDFVVAHIASMLAECMVITMLCIVLEKLIIKNKYTAFVLLGKNINK